MSKNITIQEGGVNKQMTVSKLKTDKVGGGTCLWVPEEEVSLGTKSISANGTYKASDDGKYGFSQVTVNVFNSQGSVKSDGTPNTESDTLPGGSGTSVVGTDPVTGNDYVIGVDDNGNLVSTPVPSRIEITEMPDTMDYNDGDTPDYTGLVATLKNNDGTTFTNEDYPDGTIPISKLTFPISSVSVDETSDAGMSSELVTNLPQPIIVTPAGATLFTQGKTSLYFKLPGIVYKTDDYGVAGLRIILLSSTSQNDFHLYGLNSENGVETRLGGGINSSGAVTHEGKTIYYAGGGQITVDGELAVSIPYTKMPDSNSIWTAAYGQSSGGQQALPVQWKSPYDGRTLETSYEVTVDGSGFSDDSGGSSSGGGTDIPGGGSSSDSGGSASGGGGNF